MLHQSSAYDVRDDNGVAIEKALSPGPKGLINPSAMHSCMMSAAAEETKMDPMPFATENLVEQDVQTRVQAQEVHLRFSCIGDSQCQQC